MHDVQRTHRGVAAAMCVVERLRELTHDVDGELLRERLAEATAATQERREVHARDVLHRDEVGVVRATEIEDLDDVRVRERDRDLRLVDEHLDELRVHPEFREDPLDDEDLFETLDTVRLRLEHLRHAAAREQFEQLVLAVDDGRRRCGRGHRGKLDRGKHASTAARRPLQRTGGTRIQPQAPPLARASERGHARVDAGPRASEADVLAVDA